MSFSRAYNFTARMEGGFSDDPKDRGGATNFGISTVFLTDFQRRQKSFCASLGITPPITKAVIRQLSREQARAIMKREFWDGLDLDEYPPHCAAAMFDCAVHSGQGRAARCLQEALNSVFNCKLAVDGAIGPKTKAACQLITGESDRRVALAMVDSREKFLQRFLEAAPDQNRFSRGFANRLASLRELIARE